MKGRNTELSSSGGLNLKRGKEVGCWTSEDKTDLSNLQTKLQKGQRSHGCEIGRASTDIGEKAEVTRS